MGRVLAAAAIALVVGLGAVAAPALSTKPYRAEPVDFSAAGQGVLGQPDPGEGVVSEPIRAPKRFNLVGLTWSGGDPGGDGERGGPEAHDHADEPALALRTRRDDGEWSRWAPVTAHAEDGPDPGDVETHAEGMSNPVWAGEADWVQYRSSQPLPGVRLRFVNTDGSATAADRLRTALRGAANTAVVAAAGLLSADLAGAQDPQPKMVSRASCAGNDCSPRSRPVYGEVRAAYVHHTVNTNTYSRAEAPQVVLGICRYHRNSNGWNDVGYNFLVDRFGTLYEGRAGGVGAAVVGAQAEGFNSYSTGIANIGTFSNVPQSQASLETMARLIRWKLPLHGYPTGGTAVMRSAGGGTNRYAAGTNVRVPRVLGHRDTNATECPGGALYSQLRELRSLAAGVAPSGVATNLVAGLDARRSAIDYGEEANVAGTLTTRDGAPIAGQAVTVQARIDGTWRTSSEPVTGADGTFAAPIKPKLTRDLRVRFSGAGELRASVSPTLTLAVRPALAVRLVGASTARASQGPASRLGARSPARASQGAVRGRPRMAVATGERVALRGRIRPRAGRVLQVLRVQRAGGRFRLAGTRWLKVGARGHFRGGFVPAGRGVYRIYVVARATAIRARGSSAKIDVAVRARANAVRNGAETR
jgi:hypothetical protein